MKKKNILSNLITCIICFVIITSFYEGSVFIGEAAQANLVLYLPMDEGSGTTTADESGNGHVGIIHGATWITGISGNALELDGLNDYLFVNSTNILNSVNAVTIACWIKVDSTPQLRYFVNTNGFGLFQEGNYTGLAISVSATNNAKGQVQLGTWVQITGTYDGNDIVFYNNGVFQASTNWPGTMSLGHLLFVIGFFNNEYWEGAIDELCVWNRVLTAEEVEIHYANTNCASIPISPMFLALLTLVGTIFIFKKRK